MNIKIFALWETNLSSNSDTTLMIKDGSEHLVVVAVSASGILYDIEN